MDSKEYIEQNTQTHSTEFYSAGKMGISITHGPDYQQQDYDAGYFQFVVLYSLS